MRGSYNFSPVQIVLPIVIILGLVLAYFVGSAIAQERYYLLILIAGLIGLTIWTVVGRNIWWVPMFFFPALGGYFYWGFKLHVHEIGLVFTLIPLAVVIALNRPDIQVRKHFSQGIVTVLFLYLCLHLLGCLIYMKLNGLPGFTNVLRRYMEALWPIFFLIPFLAFGSTKYLRLAMRLMFLGSIVRVCLGLFGAYRGAAGGHDAVESAVFIPFINFVPAGANAAADLRYSGPAMISMAIVYFCLYKNFLSRAFFGFFILFGTFASFLGGGRTIIVLTFILLAFPLIVYRKTYLILLAGSGLLIAVLLVNANPFFLNDLPNSVRRASTAFIFDRTLAASIGETGSSDEWHKILFNEGWKTWTENGFTILFGKGSRGFDEKAWSAQDRFGALIEMAVATGRFEKGLWDTLCTFGLVGFVLFSICLVSIIIKCRKALIEKRVSSYALGMAFIGLFQCFTWFVFCGIGGTFPSLAIMTGLVALIALEDESHAHDLLEQVPSKPNLSPAGPVQLHSSNP